VSDLYLILRHRLAHVTNWVEIDSERLREARQRLGLSYETVARRLHVSSKTYERYEKRGRVPHELLPRLAEVLELEIETAPSVPLRVAATWTAGDDLALEIIARLDRIEKLLRDRPAS
jgi:transcriptional regulator with XRE-family HTH domain